MEMAVVKFSAETAYCSAILPICSISISIPISIAITISISIAIAPFTHSVKLSMECERLYESTSVRDVSVQTHTFEYGECGQIYVQLMDMKESVFVWVGTHSASFTSLDIALLPSPSPSSLPIHSALLRESKFGDFSSLARRLGRPSP